MHEIVPNQDARLFCENTQMCFALIGQVCTAQCQGHHPLSGVCHVHMTVKAAP